MTMDAITPDLVRQLSASRWIIPVLAAMAVEHGSRFGSLARRLSISRTILSQTLDRLEQHGWVARNPGHGHPLRPEYLLTGPGQRVAAWSQRMMEQRDLLGLEQRTIGRWSLPLVHDLGHEWKRFSAIQHGLAPITPRALALELTGLRAASLVDQRLPQRLYGLTATGRNLAAAIRSGF